MFELQGATARYGSAVALHPTDLRVDAGETVALIGPSGSGKSTLLRLLLGLRGADSGTVRFKGEEIGKLDPRLFRARLGYVVQGGGLFPHLSAERNVTLLARHLGWDRVRIDARLQELAALTRFPAAALSRFPAQLSGGQAQRVSLMRALMLDPEVLLLDEPLGALDPITRYELQRDLREIFERLHKTVVLVTHDLGEAVFFASRLVLLREGKIVQAGRFEDFLSAPVDSFVTRFINAQRSPLQASRSGA
jgi:osmoprotectant transport system ATP-binding protein